jgi:succinate dehydrogenase hydrophobic anchor subunit
VSGPAAATAAGPASDPADAPEGSAQPPVRSWGWHLVQVSAWLLLVLLPVHVWSIWLAHDPGDIGVATFVDRWHSTGWRVFDWVFVVLALAHGGIGLSGVLSSMVRNDNVRLAIAAVVAVAFTALAILVSATIFSFDVT